MNLKSMKKGYALTAIFSLLSAPCFAVPGDDDATIQNIINKIALNGINKKILKEKLKKNKISESLRSYEKDLSSAEKKFDALEETLSVAHTIQDIANDLIDALEALLPSKHIIPIPENALDKLFKANDYFNSEEFTSEFDKITEEFTTLKEYFGDLDSTTIMKKLNNFVMPISFRTLENHYRNLKHTKPMRDVNDLNKPNPLWELKECRPERIISMMTHLKELTKEALEAYPLDLQWLSPWINAKLANRDDADDLIPKDTDLYAPHLIYGVIKNAFYDDLFALKKSSLLRFISDLEKDQSDNEKTMSQCTEKIYDHQDQIHKYDRSIEALEEEKERLEAEIEPLEALEEEK
jgi:hypothetical protein